MTPSEYKKFKNLPKQSKTNLRSHMNDLELIFTMLGERMTTEPSQEEKPETFDKSKDIANKGGKVAENAKVDTEKELGRPVSTKQNYFSVTDKKKLKDKRKKTVAISFLRISFFILFLFSDKLEQERP